jgi:hypothetical protein
MGTIFEERQARFLRWPQWRDIQRPLEALGLASQGSRLIAEGFQAQFIEIPRFGVAELRAFPKCEVPKGRASPHRLQVRCTCGQWVFFGKLNQHYPSLNHARMAAHRKTCEAVGTDLDAEQRREWEAGKNGILPMHPSFGGRVG